MERKCQEDKTPFGRSAVDLRLRRVSKRYSFGERKTCPQKRGFLFSYFFGNLVDEPPNLGKAENLC